MSASTPLDSSSSKRALLLRLIAFLVVVGISSWVAWYYLDARWYISTDFWLYC